MALHFGLGQAGIGALPALVRSVRRVLSGLKEEDHSYRHRWPLMAILSHAPHARGGLRGDLRSSPHRCFPFAPFTHKVVERWQAVWDKWNQWTELAGVIPDWDLNTG